MENREQPSEILLGSSSEENLNSGADEQISNGSQSKFKDVKSLEQAYLNLQSEFTRKCQRLSQLEKSNNDNLEALKLEQKPTKPFYESENWQDCVNDFLKNNPDANEFASEIVNTILMDKDLATNPNSLEIAYNKILASKYIPKEKLLEDEEFVNNFILTNKKITDKIINDYIKKLNNNAPKVIASSHLSSVGLTPVKKPLTLEEAKLMAKNMFKS